MASKKKNIFKSRKLRLVATFILFILFLGLFGFLLYSAKKKLFTENRHFIVRRINVRWGVWWKNHVDELASIIKVKKGKTNLWDINYAAAREKLLQEPTIEDVSVYKLLPDTLVISVTERIPRAFLRYRNGDLLVDAYSVIMPADKCITLPDDLPVIADLSSKDLKVGSKLPEAAGALNFIKEINSNYKRVKIKWISLKDRKIFNTIIYDRKAGRQYHLLIARDNIEDSLASLDNLLDDIKNGKVKPGANTINLSYKGLAYIK